MKRAILRALCPALAVGCLLFAGTGAQAELVQYITNGTFTGGNTSGTNAYTNTAAGISVVFNSSGTNSVTLTSAAPSSLVSFGQFNSSATSNTTSLTPITAAFTLDVIQLAPTSQTLTYLGSLSGTLTIDASGAFVQFNAPLTQAAAGTAGNILYSIVSADTGPMGRVNINAPKTQGGISTIQGSVSLQTVPEPSSVAMLALGASATLLIGLRSRRRMLVQAAA
jgi:hypothetical protein